MLITAIPNPFSKWPRHSEYSAHFRLTAANGVEFVKINKFSLEDYYILVDLRFAREKNNHFRSVPILKERPDIDISVKIDSERLSLANYVASVGERLLYLKGSSDTRRCRRIIGYAPSSICFLDGLNAASNWNGVGFADKLEAFFDLVIYRSPPITIDHITEAEISAPGDRLQMDGLVNNPYFKSDLTDKTNDLRRKLKQLINDLKSYTNTDECEFERVDLASLLRQSLIMLGDDGNMPQKTLASVPDASVKLAEKIQKTAGISTNLMQIATAIQTVTKIIRSAFGL